MARAGSANLLDLAGRHVVVSAGGTREYLDPVRFLGNRSSGLQGYALARAAAARGAEVTLVAANVALPDPAGVKVVHVETTAQLRDAVLAATATADAVVMAAAPADYRPSTVSDTKIKKADDGSRPGPRARAEPRHPRRDLPRPGPARQRGGRVRRRDRRRHGSVLDLARAKLARKGCDLLVVNDVSGGTGVRQRRERGRRARRRRARRPPVPRGSKAALAHVIWDRVAARFETG